MFSYVYMNKNNKRGWRDFVSCVFRHRGSAIGVVPNRIGRPHVTLVSEKIDEGFEPTGPNCQIVRTCQNLQVFYVFCSVSLV